MPAASNGKALSMSTPSSSVSKQLLSKPANGKMPSTGSANHASATPTVKPKADLMLLPLVHFLDDPDSIDAHHLRSLESMLEEWKCNHLHSEVADCLCDLNQPYTHAFFVHNVVTQCCDRGAHFVSKCSELLETLCRKPNCLNEAKLVEALTHLTSTEIANDMSLDCPSYKQYMTEILARGSMLFSYSFNSSTRRHHLTLHTRYCKWLDQRAGI
jgi:hypothetical protein